MRQHKLELLHPPGPYSFRGCWARVSSLCILHLSEVATTFSMHSFNRCAEAYSLAVYIMGMAGILPHTSVTYAKHPRTIVHTCWHGAEDTSWKQILCRRPSVYLPLSKCLTTCIVLYLRGVLVSTGCFFISFVMAGRSYNQVAGGRFLSPH